PHGPPPSSSLPKPARAANSARTISATRTSSCPHGRACHRDLKRGRSRAGRASAHELGPTAQTSLRYRHQTLPELRRRLEDHRRPFVRLRTGIEDPPVIVKILSHLGYRPAPPPRAPAHRVDLFQTI